jgi:hypothetical protein
MLNAILSKRDFESRVEDEDGNIVAEGLSQHGAKLFARAPLMEALLRGFVDSLQGPMEDDAPINGCDAVDWLCETYRDAKKVLDYND